MIQFSKEFDIELNAKTDITGVLEYTGFILACHWPNKDVVKLLLEYSEERNIELCDNLSEYESVPKEIIDLVELHQEASKELKHFIEMHQTKRRKL